MSTLDSRRRRRTVAALSAGLLSLLAIPVAIGVGYTALRDSESATNVEGVEPLPIPATPAALLATVDDEGELTTANVIVLSPEGEGGTVISVPVGAKAETGTEEIRRVADAYAAGGIDALAADLEGLLNVTFSQRAAVPREGLEQVLQPAGDLQVDLGGDVVDTQNGSDVVVVESGAQTLDTAQAASVLLAHKDGEAELVRSPRIKAVWDAVAANVGDGLDLDASTVTTLPDGTPSDISGFVRKLYSGPVGVWQLAADPILSNEDNPGGLDLYETNKAEIVMIMASVAPSAVSAIFPSIAFQIDSPFQDSSVTQEAVMRLIYQGANVLLVREVGGSVPKTTVLRYNDGLDLQQAKQFMGLFGDVVFEKAVEPVQGIDAQLILGQDFLDHLAKEPKLPATTTTSEDDASSGTGG